MVVNFLQSYLIDCVSLFLMVQQMVLRVHRIVEEDSVQIGSVEIVLVCIGDGFKIESEQIASNEIETECA